MPSFTAASSWAPLAVVFHVNATVTVRDTAESKRLSVVAWLTAASALAAPDSVCAASPSPGSPAPSIVAVSAPRVAVAFPLLTLGVLLGARWAYDAWGRYWGWDAKETWALITWLIYAAYLHMRLVVGWRGRKTAYLSLAGFGVVLFTYIGVNYLSELHGFLSGGGR